MTRPTEKQLADALTNALIAMDAARDCIQPITQAQIKLHRLNPQTDKLLDDAAAELSAILAAYRIAQQAEAGAAGGLPPLPAPDIWVREDFGLGDTATHTGHSDEQALSYGRQCHEAGRQQGMEQARGDIDAAQTAAYAEGRKDQAEADGVCHACAGSGETEGMAGQGPDTWTVTVPCGKCGGTGDAQPAASSARRPLTDEQIDALDTLSLNWMAPRGKESVRQFARAVEAAASSAQEPLSELARLRRERDGWHDEAQDLQRRLRFAQADADAMRAHEKGDVWFWQGDEYDHIESMANNMVVVIQAAVLRELLAAPTRMAGAAQGEALGWIADWAVEHLKANGDLHSAHVWQAPQDKTGLVPVCLLPQAQVERKPLGEGKIASIALDYWTVDPVSFTRAIEAAHGIGTASTASDEGSV